MSDHLGIIGGGQLGCLLHRAATALDIPVRIADPDPDAPGGRLPGATAVADWPAAMAAVADGAKVITWEREDLDATALAPWQDKVRPSCAVLQGTQDRLGYKQALADCDIATAPWVAAQAGDTDAVLAQLDLPVMVKARRGGFDGRGQVIARDRETLTAALETYASCGAIVEALMPFDDEFAALLTRGADGQIVHYPLVWTYQHEGQLAWALAPHPREAQLAAWIRPAAERLVQHLDHVGTLAVECFRLGDKAVVNEIAPRVHNSGHWTIEGCTADQFANHVRAVWGLPLVTPEPTGVSLLRNCIGTMPSFDGADSSDIAIHDYGKQDRPKRKVGHVTVVAPDLPALIKRVDDLPAQLQATIDTQAWTAANN